MPGYGQPPMGGGYGPPQAQQGVGYNPFSVQNLWQPMASQIDSQTSQQINQLKEQFGSQGMRWSDALARQMNSANLGAAGQKNQLFSQMMYDEANNAYGRQRDAAQMAMQQQNDEWQRKMGLLGHMTGQEAQRAQLLMQLGGMQSDRDANIINQMWGMGSDERGWQQGDLDRQYQEWLRRTMGPLEMILGATGGGYSSDYRKDPSTWEKVLPWIQAIGSFF